MILAAEIGPPALIVLAGPNGAGKSTLYRNELQDRYRSLEFINADELAMRHFGHAAQTMEETRMGQHLADARRAALMPQTRASSQNRPSLTPPNSNCCSRRWQVAT